MVYSKENSFLEERINLIYEFLNSIKIEKNVNPVTDSNKCFIRSKKLIKFFGNHNVQCNNFQSL